MQTTDRMTAFLLANANPSITYRIKKELLQNISQEEENQLQEQIMSEKFICSIVDCQKPNGWIGNGYHGFNRDAGRYTNMETGVKYLAEKGICKDSDVLKRVMTAFKDLPNTDACRQNISIACLQSSRKKYGILSANGKLTGLYWNQICIREHHWMAILRKTYLTRKILWDIL